MFKRVKIPDKIRNGRLRSMFDYFENVLDDYSSVAVDVKHGIQARPLKAFFKGSIGFLFLTAYQTNPQKNCASGNNWSCPTWKWVKWPNLFEILLPMITFSTWIDWRIKKFWKDLIVSFSVYYADSITILIQVLFTSQCEYLKPTITSYLDRIEDFGAFGIWWNMNQRIKDYDVNPDEWKSLAVSTWLNKLHLIRSQCFKVTETCKFHTKRPERTIQLKLYQSPPKPTLNQITTNRSLDQMNNGKEKWL